MAVAGRGGGHGPPEMPEGISLVDLADGSTLWSLPLEGFMSTMSFGLHQDSVIVYHGAECLKVDATTGTVTRWSAPLKRVSPSLATTIGAALCAR